MEFVVRLPIQWKQNNQRLLGDIDIIAAVGDSLTSATAANSAALWEVLIENRGVSWCIGGQGNFRTHLTLPNILKEFNPNLFGLVNFILFFLFLSDIFFFFHLF